MAERRCKGWISSIGCVSGLREEDASGTLSSQWIDSSCLQFLIDRDAIGAPSGVKKRKSKVLHAESL